jgi:hypothetical protein
MTAIYDPFIAQLQESEIDEIKTFEMLSFDMELHPSAPIKLSMVEFVVTTPTYSWPYGITMNLRSTGREIVSQSVACATTLSSQVCLCLLIGPQELEEQWPQLHSFLLRWHQSLSPCCQPQ